MMKTIYWRIMVGSLTEASYLVCIPDAAVQSVSISNQENPDEDE
jgi:hypothetical protein